MQSEEWSAWFARIEEWFDDIGNAPPQCDSDMAYAWSCGGHRALDLLRERLTGQVADKIT